MRRRSVSNLVPMAVVAAALTLSPLAPLHAQTTYPGQTDPIGGDSPHRLTQFHDDELVLFGSGDGTLPGPYYGSQEWSPGGDYAMPAGINSDALPYPPLAPSYNRWGTGISLAKGRFVKPDRDTVVALVKTTPSMTQTSWAIQEVSFGGTNPATPASVPPFAFTGSNYGLDNAVFSPGRIAAGDLNGVIDANGQYHDEVAVLSEYAPGMALSILDYSTPGQVQVAGQVLNLPGGRYAYPYNVSNLDTSFGNKTNVPYPGMIDLAVGDFDGDGYNDIAAVAMIATANQDAPDPTLSYVAYVYSYCSPASAYRSISASRPYCPTDGLNANTAMVLRSQAIIDGGPRSKFFHGPVGASAGDLDGDGKDDLAVTYMNNFQNNYNAGEANDNFTGDVRLAVLSWRAPTTQTVGAPFGTVLNQLVAGHVQAWYDEKDDDIAERPNVTYNDIPVVTGLFKFDPNLGYTFGRRQVALAYSPSDYNASPLQLELWDMSSPASPGPNPPAQWTARLYSSNKNNRIKYCEGKDNGFSLAAGNFAGVKAPQPQARPVWGLSVAFQSADPKNQFVVNTYRLDQNVITQTADGLLPETPTTQITSPVFGQDNVACSQVRPNLMALDFDGDALQLGPPAHGVLDIPEQYDYVLQEPPQHLDYFPNGGWVNISRRADFNVSYAQSQGNTFSTNTTKTSSWTGGVAEAANVTVGAGEDVPDLIGGNFSVSVGEQFHYDYAQNQQNYVGNSDAYNSKLQAQTSGGDSLEFRSKVIDLWRYPIYGTTSTVPGKPYSYYEVYLPRANNTPAQNMDDLLAQTYGYQPTHENGNALSYPAAPAATAFAPPDIGTWLLPTSTLTTPLAISCENGQRLCINKPLSEDDHQFNWGRTNSSLALEIDHTLTKGQSRDWTKKWTLSADAEVTAKLSYFTGSDSACFNFQAHGGETWGEGATSLSTSTETDALTINIPSNQDDSNAYHFNPVMYVTQDGTLKIAHATGTDNGGTVWGQRYTGPDPALNLPRKFNFPSGAAAWEINKNWDDARQLRGFFVRSPKLNPVSNTYDVVDGIKAGEKVLLQTRLYNYSVGTPAPSVPVRFDLEPVDPANNNAPTGPRVTLGITPTGAIPFHGQLDGLSNPLTNWVPVTYTLDTSTLSFSGLSQSYRVWMVVDPQGTLQQTHGWRQPNVLLTPEKTVSAGTVVSLSIQNAAGAVVDTVAYTSKGTDDNIAGGLTQALNNSAAVKAFGAIASVQDMTTTTPSIVVFKTGAQPPGNTEYRAGIVSGSQALYFVPPPPLANTVPLITASNLEYGQNNEGWSLITIYKNNVPGPMLGGNDPCAISGGYSAAVGPDINLQDSLTATAASAGKRPAAASLAAVRADGTLAAGQTTARPGQRLNVRVSAFAPIDWSGFENVTIYQGEPDQGSKVVGTAKIRGIHKDTGGHGWFTWTAPQQAGTYTLVARLQERWNDESPGNHTARLKIVVGPVRYYFPIVGRS